MQTAPASVRNWLLVVAAMIFFMIVLGALTRLTESGLSMVEWRPVTGWLPPMSDAAWQAELQKYLSSPQGRLINRGFSVDEFRQIFWLEFIHRLWGRLIGLAFALPLAWFWLRGRLTPALKPRLLALLVLILELGPQDARRDDAKTRRKATALIGFLFVVMTWGALMAGLRAGTSHNTFPTMSGYWIPPGLFDLSPWWINFFENGTTIQFVHRWLAKILVLGVLALAWRTRRPETRAAAAMALLQLGLGIATILSGVNIALATAHQAGAVLLLTTVIIVRHRALPSPARPLSAKVGAWV